VTAPKEEADVAIGTAGGHRGTDLGETSLDLSSSVLPLVCIYGIVPNGFAQAVVQIQVRLIAIFPSYELAL
jgi:hypothetical protein